MGRSVALLSLFLLGASCSRASSPPVTAAPVAPAMLTPAQIAARSTPAVVTIRSPNSLGTGFVVRPEGWIATNLHVIAGARALLVVLPDKTEHPVVEIVAVDSKRDLAIIRIDVKKKLPPLSLGDSGAVRAGDAVVAIGHPLGLEDTVSNGLVSAVREIGPTLTLLQISAPIAPGSSGGPLFNDRGEVIGVAAAVSRQGQNLNFGLPIHYLKALLEHPEPMSFAKFVEATLPALPKVKRTIPHHEMTVLKGCAPRDLALIAHILDEAVEVGAPLYNAGNFSACYHVYEGASLDAERRIAPACMGPKRALGDGRKKAAALRDPAAQAWAVRDAFDGLFDVIGRRIRGAEK